MITVMSYFAKMVSHLHLIWDLEVVAVDRERMGVEGGTYGHARKKELRGGLPQTVFAWAWSGAWT